MTEIMTKNRETKSLLAKLMASEDINVEYRENASTAAFNTETRTLIMPVFKNMTENATDLFLGHEVGHALYTPQGAIKEVMEKGGLFKGVVNIVEDARIEKMIQSKFPGLRRSFYKGYSDLISSGFFDLNGKDVNEMNFIDRINIHFKVGTRAGVVFSEDEMKIVDRIAGLRTFDETLKISNELWEYVKDNTPDNDEDEEDWGEGFPSDSDEEGEEGELGSSEGDEGSTFWCAICDVGFDTEEEMDQHAAEMGHVETDYDHEDEGDDDHDYDEDDDEDDDDEAEDDENVEDDDDD